MHTVYSDGTDTLVELLQNAQRANLDYISITDHESCGAYDELKNIEVSQYFSGVIVPGIEMKSWYQGRFIDILGYQIDTEAMKQWLKEYYEENTHAVLEIKYLTKLYERAKAFDLSMTPMEELEWDPTHEWSNIVFYQEVKKHSENEAKLPKDFWESFDRFKQRYWWNPNSKFYLDKSEDYPCVKKVIEAIHSCGGKAFLPHIFIYQWAEDKKALIQDLIENNPMDGIECYYPTFTEEQRKYLVDLCNKKGLYKSGGCDYHGKNRPGIQLGIGKGELQIPNEFVEEWLS